MFKTILIILIFTVAIPFCIKKCKEAKHYTKEKVEDVKEKVDESKVIKDIVKKTFHYGKDK